jgi:hypothetical protein
MGTAYAAPMMSRTRPAYTSVSWFHAQCGGPSSSMYRLMDEHMMGTAYAARRSAEETGTTHLHEGLLKRLVQRTCTKVCCRDWYNAKPPLPPAAVASRTSAGSASMRHSRSNTSLRDPLPAVHTAKSSPLHVESTHSSRSHPLSVRRGSRVSTCGERGTTPTQVRGCNPMALRAR